MKIPGNKLVTVNSKSDIWVFVYKKYTLVSIVRVIYYDKCNIKSLFSPRNTLFTLK